MTADLKATAIGSPVSVGNDSYCCEVLISGTCTYMPYKYGCQCNQCPVTDNVFVTLCVPCSTAAVPTVTGGSVVATPTNLTDCCNVTNAVALTTSFNVTTGA